MTGSSVQLTHLTAQEFQARVGELVDVYVAAMRYPDQVAGARSSLWHEHSTRAGFDCVVALDDDGAILGLAYGYRGRPGQWWYTEVRRGLEVAAPQLIQPWMQHFFELTELHVRPDTQGSRLGETLLRSLLRNREETHVLLSTPEGENRAWRLYRRLGFVDLLRDYRFSGDQRPFGVLGRSLPLAEPAEPDAAETKEAS